MRRRKTKGVRRKKRGKKQKEMYRNKITVNEDLLRERQKCTFDSKELTLWLDGSSEKIATRHELGNIHCDDIPI